MTLEQEAKLMGVTTDAVRLWRRGKRTPSQTAQNMRELLCLVQTLAPSVYTAYLESKNI
jgi:DNA-binding transcriptional regulator YiaG